MPDSQEITSKQEGSKVVGESETAVQMLLHKVTGESGFKPTEKQVDEVLSQRRQVYEYINQDNKRESYDSKFYFIGVLISSLLIIALTVFFAKEYLTQVISLLIGGVGGYGLGKSQTNKD